MMGQRDVAAVEKRPMSADQARACVDAIKERVDDIRDLALDLYERQGWKALGYPSWRECVKTEFEQHQSYLYRQLQAALIEREITNPGEIGNMGSISPIGEKPARIPEGQLRPLAAIPEGQRKEAWEEAKTTAPNGKVTGKHVEDVVNKRTGNPEKSAKPEADPDGHGKTLVNGVPSEDPPEIARARANGRIAADAVVEITEPEPTGDEAAEAPRASDESGLDDEAWLASLPLRPKLSGSARKWFEVDALFYRAMEPARRSFKHHADVALKAARGRGGNGEYAYRVSSFFRLDHPRHWNPCPRPEDGGCGGSGTVGLIGQCPKCHGRGYWIK